MGRIIRKYRGVGRMVEVAGDGQREIGNGG